VGPGVGGRSGVGACGRAGGGVNAARQRGVGWGSAAWQPTAPTSRCRPRASPRTQLRLLPLSGRISSPPTTMPAPSSTYHATEPQVMLKQDDGVYACIAEDDVRYNLGEVSHNQDCHMRARNLGGAPRGRGTRTVLAVAASAVPCLPGILAHA
jgi:hypothetical protein